MDGRIVGVDGMERWRDGWMNGWLGWMHGWMDEWMYGKD
jgi:hypothetical protein